MIVGWTNKARKQLKKLKEPRTISKVLRAVDDLEAEKANLDIKPLINHQYSHRLMVGNYRIFLTMNEVVEITFIEEVKKRDERTY